MSAIQSVRNFFDFVSNRPDMKPEAVSDLWRNSLELVAGTEIDPRTIGLAAMLEAAGRRQDDNLALLQRYNLSLS